MGVTTTVTVYVSRNKREGYYFGHCKMPGDTRHKRHFRSRLFPLSDKYASKRNKEILNLLTS